MTEDSYDFWVKWKLGLINRELTKKETADIKASEFAMHLLFPTPLAEALINKYGQTIFCNKIFMEMIAENLDIPYEVAVFKLQDTFKQKELKHEEKAKKKKHIKSLKSLLTLHHKKDSN